MIMFLLIQLPLSFSLFLSLSLSLSLSFSISISMFHISLSLIVSFVHFLSVCCFLKLGIPGLIFVLPIWYIEIAMTGFELQISSVKSDHSTNCATTADNFFTLSFFSFDVFNQTFVQIVTFFNLYLVQYYIIV